VRVGAGPRVVGEIPAVVVGIFIDYDRIGIPDPVADIGVIVGSNGKIYSVKPETLPASTTEPENMARPESECESAVFKGPVHVIMTITAS